MTASPSHQTGRIFISYRRDDSAGYAGRIFDRLTARFGKESIFMDVATIPAGLDFVEVLENAVQSCDVLVALMGRQWLNIMDEAGRRRLDNPQDFVRIEVAAALSRNIRVIPVLVDGTPMPSSSQLPGDLELLARRNAVLIDHPSFDADTNRLVEQLELALKDAEDLKILKAKKLKEEEVQKKRWEEIENILSQADIALELQDWELAKEKLVGALTLEPNHAQAQVKLSFVDRKQREIKEKEEQKAAEEKAAKAKAERDNKARADRKAQQDADRLASQKAEQERRKKEIAKRSNVKTNQKSKKEARQSTQSKPERGDPAAKEAKLEISESTERNAARKTITKKLLSRVFLIILGLAVLGTFYKFIPPYFEPKIQIIFEPDYSLVTTVNNSDLEKTAEILVSRFQNLGYKGVTMAVMAVNENHQIVGLVPQSFFDQSSSLSQISAIGLLEFVDFGQTEVPIGTTITTDLNYKYFPQGEGEILHTVFTNSEIESVSVEDSFSGQGYDINFSLTPDGTQIMAEHTANNIGRILGIVLDKAVISLPRINSAITGGVGTISGNFSKDEADLIASYLLAKEPLPIPIHIIETRVVE